MDSAKSLQDTTLDIKQITLKQREDWMIMDDQYFSFEAMSKIYSVKDVLRMWQAKTISIQGFIVSRFLETTKPCIIISFYFEFSI